MFLRFLLVFISLLLNMHGAFAAKETIVHIGGIATVLTKSTSCNRDKWGKLDENACRCCITKHYDKGQSTQATLAYCSKDSKHCSDESIRNIANAEKLVKKNPVEPDEFVTTVANAAYAISEVTLNESVLKNAGTSNGELDNETAVYFLKIAAEKDFIENYKDKLKMGDECIDARSMNSGGAQTLQLFAIVLKSDERCGPDAGKTIFILKEMKKAKDEVLNLEKIRNSEEMSKYLLENDPQGLSIALAHQNLIYRYGKNTHFMSLLPTAPGASINKFLENYFGQDPARPSKVTKDDLKLAFCGAGRALAEFNIDTMKPKGAIFGKVVSHGDLHVENFFLDIGSGAQKRIRATLIDNESMAASLTRKQPVDIDLIRIFAHATSRFWGVRAREQSALYNDKNQSEWDEIFFKSFIECYAKAYPSNKLVEVKRELKKIYASAGIFSLLRSQRIVYSPLQWANVQKSLVKVIEDIK